MRPKQQTNTKMLEVIRKAVETITSCDVVERTRQREYVQARSIFYRFARDNKQTLQAIGKFLKRDHATVMHSLKKFEQDVEYDSVFRANYNAVKDILGNLDVKGCEDATETLLEAYEMRNTYLIEQNAELRAKLSRLTSDDTINELLTGLPESRIQYFIDNQLKSFVNIEKAILKRDEAQREADLKAKREFKRLAMHEEGGLSTDGKIFRYASI
tara:strand:- start:207 stop:848 length:642 start_codon:yes stop_codon:yes gene_type:complete